MGGKKQFFRVRSDDELKAALKASADRSDRREADQARYLLRIALGLLDDSETRLVNDRIKQIHDPHKKADIRRPRSA